MNATDAVTSTDPSLAIVAKWRAAHAALPNVDNVGSRDERERQEQRFNEAVAALCTIEGELATTTPTTPAGAAASVRLVLEVAGDDLGEDLADVLERVADFLEQGARQ
jgi:hypothetical protein